MPNPPQGPTVKIKRASKSSLEQIAREIKAQQIDVLAWAVDALSQYYKHHGNRLILPLRFTETFQVFQVSPHVALHEPPESGSNPGAGAAPTRTKSRGQSSPA